MASGLGEGNSNGRISPLVNALLRVDFYYDWSNRYFTTEAEVKKASFEPPEGAMINSAAYTLP